MSTRFEPAARLSGELRAPPDKSISHRAALLGAMASEPVRIDRYLQAADTNATLEAVRALGALVEVRGEELLVRGTGLREAREPEGPIDVGNAGTLLRLLPGWLAAQEGRSFTLDGDDSIRRRPVDRIAAPLRQMGAEVQARNGRFPPLQVTGGRLRIDSSPSSVKLRPSCAASQPGSRRISVPALPTSIACSGSRASRSPVPRTITRSPWSSTSAPSARTAASVASVSAACR